MIKAIVAAIKWWIPNTLLARYKITISTNVALPPTKTNFDNCSINSLFNVKHLFNSKLLQSY